MKDMVCEDEVLELLVIRYGPDKQKLLRAKVITSSDNIMI